MKPALKVLLTGKRIRLATIAEDLGVSRGHVSNVLAGRFPSRSVCKAVAAALGMDADEFIEKFIARKAV